MRKLLISVGVLAGLLAGSLRGQYAPPAFSTTKTTALSGAAEVITVQKPVAMTDAVNFVAAYVSSTVAVTVQFEVNGTAATTTLLTVNALSGKTPNATAFSASNVGSGTVVSPAYDIAANAEKTFDLSKIWLKGAATANNLTLRTSAISGTVKIIFVWVETP